MNELTDPFAVPSENSKTVVFDLVLEHGDKHLPVHGKVTLDSDTPQSDSCIRIGFGYRVIRKATECFQSRDGEERYAGIGVSGWLDLGDGWQPYLSTTKDAIDDAPLFEALMGHVFEKIKTLLQEAEKKSFNLHLDNLAIGLERALNAKGGDVVVNVGLEFGRRRGDPNPDPDPQPGPPAGPVPEVQRPGDIPGEIEQTRPPSLAIAIIQTTDAQLKGALCEADIRENDIIVSVNQDHAYVQEALKARPIDAMALNGMIVNELAQAIVGIQGGAFIKKIFHRELANAICEIEQDHHRSRIVARRLIDRVRNPAMAA
jgi:hypothetical protein